MSLALCCAEGMGKQSTLACQKSCHAMHPTLSYTLKMTYNAMSALCALGIPMEEGLCPVFNSNMSGLHVILSLGSTCHASTIKNYVLRKAYDINMHPNNLLSEFEVHLNYSQESQCDVLT